MIKLDCIATVTYTCYLTKEDEEKVNKYYEEHKYEYDINFLSERKIKQEIINKLYDDNEIDIYENSIESDFETNDIYVNTIEE